MNLERAKWLLLASVASALLSDPALAQNTAQGAADGAETTDIVVTARRTEERSQDVPLSIVAFNPAALRENQVTDGQSLGRVAPGLIAVAGSGNPTLTDFSIRGRGLNFGASSGSVETYFADIPLSPPFQITGLPPQFFDMASVQVLKGPQGTLFGRSTTGGAVLLQPQLPTDRLEGYARAQGGNFNNVQLEGAVNLPVVENLLAVRLAGFYWNRDGYVKNSPTIPAADLARLTADPAALARQFGRGTTVVGGNIISSDGRTIVSNGTIIDGANGQPVTPSSYNNRDVREIRASFRLTPAANITNDTIFTYHEDNNTGGSGGSLLVVRNALGAVTGAEAGLGLGTYTGYRSSSQLRPVTRSYLLVNTTTVDLTDSLRIKNIFGYMHSKGYVLTPNDTDGGPGRIIDGYTSSRPIRSNQYTDELQIQGSALGDKLKYTLGGLIDRTRAPRDPNNLNIVSASSTAIATLIDPAAPNAQPRLERMLSTNINSDSIYASFTFAVSDQLTLSAGYRHIWDAVDALQASALKASDTAPSVYQDADPDVAGFQQVRRLYTKMQGDVYNAGIDYKVTPDNLIYASFRHGFKRGGFNSSSFGGFPFSFGPEKVDSYAIGTKNTFDLGGARLRLNVEAFLDNYKGYQGSYLQFAGGSLLTITTNIPKVRYKGFDVALDLQATSILDFNLSYSYLDAKITNFTDNTLPGVNPGLEVNRLPFASKHQLQAAVRLHTQLGEMGELVVRPSMTYQSEFYTTLFNRTLPAAQKAVFGPFDNLAIGGGTVPGVTLADLRVELNKVGGSNVSLAVGATNLFDKYYYVGNSGTLSFGAQGNAVGAPRMIYGEVSVRF
jgi:iron complex outermembrane recepter protein